MNSRKFLLGLTLIAAITSTSMAGFPAFGHLPDFSDMIRHRQMAEKLPTGTKVALACKKCQGRNIRTVDERKTFLAWFDTHQTQKCDGCGGAMKLKRNPHGNHNTHVCSKCGDNSASVCAVPPKKK